jgi:hypothetical protein
VLDAGRVVRYRGRVDDKFGARLKANAQTTRHDPHRPPQDVARGEGTTDEMLFGFLGMTSGGPGGTVRAQPVTDPAAYRPAK